MVRADAAQPAPLFGVNVDPSSRRIDEAFRRARIADTNGLDLITIQDHPYLAEFLDTWTLLTAVAMATQHVHVGTNVACTPLRPPAMLAKMAASLDVLTGGRVELGLGAGAFGTGIEAFGGRFGTATERYQAFREVVEVIRGMWEHAGGSFTYAGKFHQVRGARSGPAPAHRIRIWVGATGPRMLRLTGQLADGVLISTSYVPPDHLPEVNRRIDEGAADAGRSPSAIRRGYNLMGVIDLGRPDTQPANQQQGIMFGTVAQWIDEIVRLYKDFRQDTFIFWPVAGNELVQVEAFALEVVPPVRARLAGASG